MLAVKAIGALQNRVSTWTISLLSFGPEKIASLKPLALCFIDFIVLSCLFDRTENKKKAVVSIALLLRTLALIV